MTPKPGIPLNEPQTDHTFRTPDGRTHCRCGLGQVEARGIPLIDEPTLTCILSELAPVIGGDLDAGGVPYRVALSSSIVERLAGLPVEEGER